MKQEVGVIIDGHTSRRFHIQCGGVFIFRDACVSSDKHIHLVGTGGVHLMIDGDIARDSVVCRSINGDGMSIPTVIVVGFASHIGGEVVKVECGGGNR